MWNVAFFLGAIGALTSLSATVGAYIYRRRQEEAVWKHLVEHRARRYGYAQTFQHLGNRYYRFHLQRADLRRAADCVKELRKLLETEKVLLDEGGRNRLMGELEKLERLLESKERGRGGTQAAGE